jgi:LPS sulfotransferase NodH
MSHHHIRPCIALALVAALTAATTTHAATRQIDVRLLTKPQLSEEGIHIQTAQGHHAMYALRAKDTVYRAFERARAGQCLRLHVTPDFDFTDASQISKVSTDCR